MLKYLSRATVRTSMLWTHEDSWLRLLHRRFSLNLYIWSPKVLNALQIFFTTRVSCRSSQFFIVDKFNHWNGHFWGIESTTCALFRKPSVTVVGWIRITKGSSNQTRGESFVWKKPSAFTAGKHHFLLPGQTITQATGMSGRSVETC